MKSTATYDGQARAINRTDGGRVVASKNIKGSAEMDFPIGDGLAEVSATRGFKNWFSTRDAGMTVESTVSITIKCGQTEDEIVTAVHAIGELAEALSKEGTEAMGLHLESFDKELQKRGR